MLVTLGTWTVNNKLFVLPFSKTTVSWKQFRQTLQTVHHISSGLEAMAFEQPSPGDYIINSHYFFSWLSNDICVKKIDVGHSWDLNC